MSGPEYITTPDGKLVPFGLADGDELRDAIVHQMGVIKDLRAVEFQRESEIEMLRHNARIHLQSAVDMQRRIKTLEDALRELLDNHCRLVNSGDCGNWDVEKEEAVKKARALLSNRTGDGT